MFFCMLMIIFLAKFSELVVQEIWEKIFHFIFWLLPRPAAATITTTTITKNEQRNCFICILHIILFIGADFSVPTPIPWVRWKSAGGRGSGDFGLIGIFRMVSNCSRALRGVWKKLLIWSRYNYRSSNIYLIIENFRRATKKSPPSPPKLYELSKLSRLSRRLHHQFWLRPSPTIFS